MQTHVEAHLVLNINTSVSEFAMSTFPPSASQRSLLVRVWPVQHGSRGPRPSCCAVKNGVREGELVLIETRELKQYDTARECHLFPVLLLWIWMSAVLIGFIFDLSLIFVVVIIQHLFGILTSG